MKLLSWGTVQTQIQHTPPPMGKATWFWGTTEGGTAQGAVGCSPLDAGACAGEDAAQVSTAPGLL